MKTVIVIHWDGSAYDTLRGLLTAAGSELDPADYRVVTVTLGAEGWKRRLEETANGGDCAFALTMAGLGVELATPNGTNFWEAARVPIFAWYGDHPAHYPSRHVIRSPFVVHGYVFADHARYHRDHLNPNGVAFSVPLGLPGRPGLCGQPLPPSRRNQRILFAKTGGNPVELERRWRAGYPAPFAAVLFAASEELRGRNTADFPDSIARAADAEGIHVAPGGQAMMTLIRELDLYLRARHATLIAESIRSYPVDVVGNQWGHIDWTGAAARWAGAVRFADLMPRLPSYLGSLSVNPLTDASVHERVFYALSAGVVPIGDANEFTRSRMALLAPYSYTVDRHAIQAAVEAVLADPARAIDASEATYQAMLPTFSTRESMRRIAAFCALHPINVAL